MLNGEFVRLVVIEMFTSGRDRGLCADCELMSVFLFDQRAVTVQNRTHW